MQRRSFLTLFGGAAAAWPLAAGAQQQPVIGALLFGSPEGAANLLSAFRSGLGEAGYVEGQNVSVEYRWAEGHLDRLPALATELVQRRVAVIVAPDHPAPALAAKAATTTIPIVFSAAQDPVENGLVASLNRPGGNVTGIHDMNVELGAKRLGLLHELMPPAARFAVLANSAGGSYETHVAATKAAATATGRQIELFTTSNNRDIDRVFASFMEKHVAALAVTPALLFGERLVQIIILATHHGLPTIYPGRQEAQAGGLMSYGPVPTERYRLVGIYCGRILKGEKPADLPVMRPTKFEFVINLQTARTLGIKIPPTLLAIADEVIE